MTDFELVTAGPADLQLVLPLVRDYHEFEGIIMTEQRRSQALAVLLGNDTYGRLYLIDHHSERVGYIALCYGYSIEFAGRDAFVDEFFIRASARGLGIGGAVLNAVKRQAESDGVVALHLEVEQDNAPAQRLYARAGFVPRRRFNLMSCKLGSYSVVDR